MGLKIRQQLDTHKLFCGHLSELSDFEVIEFVRLLRPAPSDTGEVDRATIIKAKKDLKGRVDGKTVNLALKKKIEELFN